MNIAIISMWRNSAHNVERYMGYVRELQDHVGDSTVRVIAAEGDSIDNTKAVLLSYGPMVQVVDVSHGGPVYGSTEEPERLTALSWIVNKAFNAVTSNDDVVVWVESDLVWTGEVMSALVHQLRDSHYDVLAPLIFAGECFYDVWGFRADGCRFGPFAPYHHSLSPHGLMTSVDSVGSCFAARNQVAVNVRVHDNNALVGWCDAARFQGYSIGVVPTLRINHP